MAWPHAHYFAEFSRMQLNALTSFNSRKFATINPQRNVVALERTRTEQKLPRVDVCFCRPGDRPLALCSCLNNNRRITRGRGNRYSIFLTNFLNHQPNFTDCDSDGLKALERAPNTFGNRGRVVVEVVSG